MKISVTTNDRGLLPIYQFVYGSNVFSVQASTVFEAKEDFMKHIRHSVDRAITGIIMSDI